MSENQFNFNVKKATPEDSLLVVQFVDKLITELDRKKSELNLDFSTEICKKLLSNDRNASFIALDKNKEVGIITVVESNAIYAGGSFGIINELYVLPKYRSSKIGKLLVNEVINFGKQKNWKRIEVGAPHREGWERTFNFYLREGFIEIGPRLKKHL